MYGGGRDVEDDEAYYFDMQDGISRNRIRGRAGEPTEATHDAALLVSFTQLVEWPNPHAIRVSQSVTACGATVASRKAGDAQPGPLPYDAL